MKVSFIGLGTMGYPMAGHLQQSGLEVTVYNRNHQKALDWQTQYGGHIADTPSAASQEADIVMTCVGNDDDLRAVCYGDNGILTNLQANAILVDHTTTSSEVALEIAAACQQQGADFLDAPVSGGEVGAQTGQLTIMVGGKLSVFEAAQNSLNTYAKSVTHLGDTGAGQICKMVNQVCAAGVLQGLAEGLTLAQKAGLNLVQVRDVLKHGAAQSWQLEHRTESIANDQFDFGFAIDWMRKDLKICMQYAKQFGLTLPLTEIVDHAYGELQKQGHNRDDTSVLIKATQQQLFDSTDS